MLRRRPLPRLVLLLAIAPLACGSEPSAGGGEGAERRAELERREQALVRRAPPELARLYDQGGELLEGGVDAFRERLRALRGHPVVVNKWASWCGPCREELPYFRRQAYRRGERIAFLGADTNDSEAAARAFLREVPLPFPSYVDREGEIARAFRGAIAFPTTAIYGSDGRLATVKQGAYASEQELAADLDRYAR